MEGVSIGVGNEHVSRCRATTPRDLGEFVFEFTHVQQNGHGLPCPVLLATQAIFAETFECLPLFVSGLAYIARRLPVHRLILPTMYLYRNPRIVTYRSACFCSATPINQAERRLWPYWNGSEMRPLRDEEKM